MYTYMKSMQLSCVQVILSHSPSQQHVLLAGLLDGLSFVCQHGWSVMCQSFVCHLSVEWYVYAIRLSFTFHSLSKDSRLSFVRHLSDMCMTSGICISFVCDLSVIWQLFVMCMSFVFYLFCHVYGRQANCIVCLSCVCRLSVICTNDKHMIHFEPQICHLPSMGMSFVCHLYKWQTTDLF